MIESWNVPFASKMGALRSENGRWTERFIVRFIFDDLPRDDNTVTIYRKDPRLAETTFHGYSDYAERGVARIPQMVDVLSRALPIERISRIERGDTDAHIQGTVVMGNDPKPASSIDIWCITATAICWYSDPAPTPLRHQLIRR